MMEPKQINRRDFLKLFALSALTGWGINKLSNHRDRTDKPQITDLPNIIIVVFDALSAKHISLYGYQRDTTPNLSKFAEKSTVFHRHYASGNFTMPGTASLLTGVYPWSHGGYHLYGTVGDGFKDRNILNSLSDRYYTSVFTRNPIARGLLNQFGDVIRNFPEVEQHSVFSSTFSNNLFPQDPNVSFWSEKNIRGSSQNNSASPFISSLINRWNNTRVSKITESYKNIFPRGLPTNLNGQHFILEDAIDWMLSEISSSPKPLLGYYHLFPPHFPYRTRTEFDGKFEDGWQPVPKPAHFFTQERSDEFLAEERRYYDEYIAYADAEFGRFIKVLESTRMLENTLLIFTSDHGEIFERGIFQHLTPTLFEPLIHIPLVIHTPHQTQRRDIYKPTSCVDIVPTLLAIVDQPIPAWCEGKTLPIDNLKATLDDDRNIYALEAKSNAKWQPLTNFTMTLVADQFKLIHYRGYEGFEHEYELYDLENDPEELNNIYENNPGLAETLRKKLEQKISEINRKMILHNESKGISFD